MLFDLQFRRGWLARPHWTLRYGVAVLLPVAAQLARLPLHPPTLMPYITYAPFLALSAAFGGFGPGILTTAMCLAESLYFATEPVGSLAVANRHSWVGLGTLLATGTIISILFERARNARQAFSSAREMAALLKQTYDAVFVWGLADKRITFWDEGASRLYGYSREEAMGRSVAELLDGPLLGISAECLEELQHSGAWEGEVTHITRNGVRITVECRMLSRRDDTGRMLVIEVSRDISERKRLEMSQALLKLEKELGRQTMEAVVQHSPACIALLRGPEFIFEALNPAYQDLLHGEAARGRTLAEAWPEAVPMVVPLLKMVRDTRTPYRTTGALIPRRSSPSGPVEDRYFDFSYVPLPLPNGEVQILVFAIDITRFKTVEKALREANQELSTIYANAPVALMVLDKDARVRKLNEMAARLAGTMESQPLGQAFGGVVGCANALIDPLGCGYAPDCAECPVRAAVEDTMFDRTQQENIEAWLPLTVQGRPERRCLLISTAFMQTDEEARILVCAHDISAAKASEQTLRETVHKLESALAQKTVLLKEVHHRVKNNLAVISSLLNMKADASDLPEVRIAMEDSRRRVLSIALIHEHLYGSDHLDRINFHDYGRQFVEQLSTFFGNEPQRVVLRLDIAPVEMGVHRAVPCALILNELLSNAFKHAFPGGASGEICISLQQPEPNLLELAVADNGVGCPPGQADRQTRSLGLKIVDILCRQLGGSMKLESGAAGGTRFVLQFPAGTSRGVGA